MIGNIESVGCELARRLDHIGPFQLAVPFERERKPCDCARHARRFVADRRSVFDYVALLVEIHIAVCSKRSAFAVINDFGVAIRAANHHESAAAEITRRRPGRCERQSNSYSCINSIAAPLHDLCAYARGDWTGGSDYAVARSD